MVALERPPGWISDERAIRSLTKQRVPVMSAPVRVDFVAPTGDEGRSPLSLVLNGTSRGGRGGRTRLALLLSAQLACYRDGYARRSSPSWWASLIGIDVPESAAASRSVRTGLRTLADRGFIELVEMPGRAPKVSLRDECLRGRAYTRPWESAPQEAYFRLPVVLWEKNVIGRLSAAGLTMLVLLYAEYDTRDPKRWFAFPKGITTQRYRIAEATRAKGLKELVQEGVAETKLTYPYVRIEGEDRKVKRRHYRITTKLRPPQPMELAEGENRRDARSGPRTNAGARTGDRQPRRTAF